MTKPSDIEQLEELDGFFLKFGSLWLGELHGVRPRHSRVCELKELEDTIQQHLAKGTAARAIHDVAELIESERRKAAREELSNVPIHETSGQIYRAVKARLQELGE